MIESELISLFLEGYTKLVIDIIIKYNNRKLMNGIIESCNISKDKTSQVITILDKIEKLSRQEIKDEFYKINIDDNQIANLMNILNMEFEELDDYCKNSSISNIIDGISELKELNKYIKELNLTKYVKFLPTLARGQEYYTGTIFEVYMSDESIKSSIGGGGRYDNMIGEFINDNKKYPAVGISFGLDVIFEILKEKQISISNTDVYIIPMGNNILALKLAEELRKNNINTDIEMNNLRLKKALSIVNEKKIPVTIILGEDELKENKVIIKDMKNNIQLCESLSTYLEKVIEVMTKQGRNEIKDENIY